MELPPLQSVDSIVECWHFDSDRGEPRVVSVDDVISATEPPGRIVWGFSPVGPLHFAYDGLFALISALRQQSGRGVTIFVADSYAVQSRGLSLEETRTIGSYYLTYIRHIWQLPCVEVWSSDVVGSSEYQRDLMTLSNTLAVSRVKESWTADDKAEGRLYSLLYPVMQNLDLFSLRPGIVFAEASQRKFYRLLPHLARGLNKRLEAFFVFATQARDLRGRPLRGSTGRDRLSIHESMESLRWKLSRCACLPGDPACPFSRLVLYSLLPFVRDFDGWDRMRSRLDDGEMRLPAALDEICALFEARLREIEVLFDRELVDWIDYERIRSLE